MLLDEKSTKIFKEIVLHPETTTNHLCNKFNLSRNQVNYVIKKIDEWLEFNSRKAIERTKTGAIILDRTVCAHYSLNDIDYHDNQYIPNKEERMRIIILIILSSLEDLSLLHFIDYLQVSKNTVLRDLKETSILLLDYNLRINYSRTDGYSIIGEESQKRKLINDIVSYLIKLPYGKYLLPRYGKVSKDIINCYKNRLEQVEKYLKIKYSDDKLWITCYTLIFFLRRIRAGKTIGKDYGIKFKELSDTKEYEALDIIIENTDQIPDEEKIYITLHLLSINMNEMTDEESIDIKKFLVAIREFLILLEQKLTVQIKNQDELAEKLLLHLKSAYYRIKYDLTIHDIFMDRFYTEYKAMFFLVKESLAPLERFVGKAFPDQETLLISMLVNAWLSQYQEEQTENYVSNAIVVCAAGVITSNVLEKKLKVIFPFIKFLGVMSKRKFEEYENQELQSSKSIIVFSTIPLNSRWPVIIVDEDIDENSQGNLNETVWKAISESGIKCFGVEKIIKIIEKYLYVNNEAANKIKSDLLALNNTSKNEFVFYEDNKKIKQGLQLLDLLQPEYIQIVEAVSWDEALEVAFKPLLDNKVATREYLETMKKLYPNVDLCVDFSNRILIPHARPKDGAKKVGLSFLKISKGIAYKKTRIYFVVIIAAVDGEKHAQAIIQLLNLAGNEEAIRKMREASSKDEILGLIRQYVN